MTNKQVTCPRCDGTGHIAEYVHVSDGICFKCNGTGKVSAPRKPSRWQLDKQAAREMDKAIIQEVNGARMAKAQEMYRNDPRLRVDVNHPYYYMHAMELAKKDGKWESLYPVPADASAYVKNFIRNS